MIVLALDTATEDIACAIACVKGRGESFDLLASADGPAPRSANTQLVGRLERICDDAGMPPSAIEAVVCGRGPGSFTGTRIAVATAKGLACGLRVPLYGVSTLEAVAWQMHLRGIRGLVCVAGDAMRKEVYPVRFRLGERTVERLECDSVAKPQQAFQSIAQCSSEPVVFCGNGLFKYRDLAEQAFLEAGKADLLSFADKSLWLPCGKGVLSAFCSMMRDGMLPSGDPGAVLPVYTRLSDAEENERRVGGAYMGGKADDVPDSGVSEGSFCDGLLFRPMHEGDVGCVAELEASAFEGEGARDAWTVSMLEGELGRADRIWWVALEKGRIVGVAGAMVSDGDAHVLNIAVSPLSRRSGVATGLLLKLDDDARSLGAESASLEVRPANAPAISLYESCGFARLGSRPHFYPDGADALVMRSALPLPAQSAAGHGRGEKVAGMELSPVMPSPNRKKIARPLILAIESSCDETGCAVIDGDMGLCSDLIASQIDFHARFGGVVPEIASRKHIEAICGVCDEALARAGEKIGVPNLDYGDLDAVAVTCRPGLVGALVIGIAFAKGLCLATGKPLIDVNHLEGHLFANRLITPDIKPPMVALLVSGGHTMLVSVKDWGRYETLGSTLDDAVGEAFDKVAKALGLGYPGGPVISRLAKEGDASAIDFPRAMMRSEDFRFSLSGLKTAVITYLRQADERGERINVADVAASFQQAVVDVLVSKTCKAITQTGAEEFCLGGGVAANPELRDELVKAVEGLGVRVTLPPVQACTDNAGMIAAAALSHYESGAFADMSVDALAHAPLDDEDWRGKA